MMRRPIVPNSENLTTTGAFRVALSAAEQRLQDLELALQRRDAILAAVGLAARRFLGGDEWQSSLREVLERLGEAAEVSRVALFEFCREDDGALRATLHSYWSAPGMGPLLGEGETHVLTPADTGLARWVPMLLRGEMIHGPVRAMPDGEQQFLAAQQCRSLAVVPVFVGGDCWGLISLHDCRVEREWAAMELEALRTAASTLGAALQRKRSEAALRESEERYRRLTDATTEGIIIHDHGVVLDANPAFARIFGYELDELTGRNVLDFLATPESRELVLSRIRAGSEEPYEAVGLRKDGSRIAVELSARPALYRGRPVRVGAVRDITERKRAEEQARQLIQEQAARAVAEEAERRAAFLAEASRVLAASFDYHTTLTTLAHLAVPTMADYCAVDILEADDTLQRLGVAHVDPAKEHLVEELALFRAQLDAHHPLVGALREGRSELVPEMTDDMIALAATGDEHRHMMEQLRTRSYMCVPLAASGRVLGALSLCTTDDSGRRYDADDLTHAEELARRAALAVENARLFHHAQRAIRARDDMLGVVAHDLRNPLSTILMGSELLLETIPAAERPRERRQVEIVRRSAERMNRLIQDLLDVRRLDAGHLAVEPRPEPPEMVVADALEMLRPLAAANGLRLESEVADGLPRALVDPTRIQQVLSNLVGNAVKFTPAGGVVTVRAEAAGGEVRFAVADTGPGIPAEQLPHIFGQFWQGRSADRRGIGLGLAIAKGVVEAHRGRIWVQSEPGAGSTFYFTVPAASTTS